MTDRTPVIVGMGIVSPAGNSIDELAQNIFSGTVGNIRRIEAFPTEGFSVQIAGELKRDDVARKEDAQQLLVFSGAGKDAVREVDKAWRRMDNYTKDVVLAGARAAVDVGMPVAQKELRSEDIEGLSGKALLDVLVKGDIPVIAGSGYGGLGTAYAANETVQQRGPRRVNPLTVQESMINSPSARLASALNFYGANYGVSSACSSGNQALALGYRAIRDGADAAFILAGDALELPAIIASFANAGALSKRNDDPKTASRPYDVDRDGFVLSEGAAALYLMPKNEAEKRGVRIYAEIAGAGESADAVGISNLAEPDVKGPARSMALALDSAGADLAEVVYINAHGTSTIVGDRNEIEAVSRIFGQSAPPVSSTKSMTGHHLGASGGVEAIITSLALLRGQVPGNVNLFNLDPEIAQYGVPLPTQTEKMRETGKPRVALSNSFGFGGTNVTVALREYRQFRA